MGKKPTYNELEKRVKELEKSALENERLKQALQESEKQYRILVENAADIIYRTNALGFFTFFNPAGTKLTGYVDTDLIGKHYTDIIHANYRSEVERFYGRQFAKKIPVTYLELPLITAKQKQVWVGQHVQLTIEDGQIIGFQAIARDITERKKMEESLRRSEQYFKEITENSSDILIITDKNGYIKYCSLSIERFTGYKPEELIGKNGFVLIHPDDIKRAGSDYSNALLSKDSAIPNAFRIVCKDGSERDFEGLGRNLLDNPAVAGFIMNVHDVTERKRAVDELKKSEERYRIVADNVRDVIWAFDVNKGYTFVSPSVKLLRGYTPEEAMKQTPEQIFTPESFNKFNEVLKREYSLEISGKKHGADWSYTTELEMVCKDGSTVWTELVMNILYNEQGETTGLTGITRDITERKQAEETLRKSEKRLLGITRNMPGVVFQFYAKDNGEYGISYVSERLSDLFEVPSDTELEALFPIFISHIKEEDLDRFTASVQNAVKTVAPWNFEGRYIKPLGKMFWFHAISIPTRQEDRLVFDGILLDITERKEAEEALRDSEELYTQLVDTIPDIVIRTDLNGHILLANDYAFQRGGYKREEVEERNILEFILSEEHERVIQNITRIMEEGKHGPYEYHLIMKDGSLIPFEVTSGVLRSTDGTPRSLVHVCRDITLRQQNEQEKKSLQERLSQAQKMESIGRLAGGVAHDFNNMLGVILGHTELVMEMTDPEQPIHSHLREVRKAAERSANLTRQLLAFARKQTVTPIEIDINETVGGMIKMLQRLIGEDIHLSWQPCVNPWKIKIDPSQIDQILANMCVNARDAIAGVGRVSIESGNISINDDFCTDRPDCIPGDYVVLVVSDDGCGMSKDIQNKLFEPFFTTKEVGKGTGLGLSTVYGIVKQNNGFINVYSEPDQGTTFSIYLPRYIGKTKQTKIEKQQELAFGGRETVLVAEDESAILDLIKIMLEQQGYYVLAAATPGEAIQMAEEHNGELHLLITDVVMPEMNGRDLAKRILSLYPNIKRLFMSGYTDNMIAHHGILDEGVCFIQKPFFREDLIAKVREVLDQK